MPEISGSRLAELTGKQWRTVKARLESAGIRPLRRERNADLFDSASALAAIYAGDSLAGGDFDNQRERLAAAQAEKVEMENAVRQRKLADLTQTEAVWTDMIANARAKVLGIGSKLGTQLVNIGDANVIAAAIRSECNAALGELQQYRLPDEPSGPGGEGEPDMGAPADPDGKRVGRPRKAAK
jgi:phage terminase Nu1 subunit (DNA packaging protein)